MKINAFGILLVILLIICPVSVEYSILALYLNF